MNGDAVREHQGRDGEAAARIPLTESAVLDLLRKQFARLDTVLVQPHISSSKERAARAIYEAYLPREERILAMHDGLDSGSVGFVLSTTRLCWTTFGENPRALTWRALDPEEVQFDGDCLIVGENVLPFGDPDLLDACANVFLVLAVSAVREAPSCSRSFVTSGDPEGYEYEEASEGWSETERPPAPRYSATPPPPCATSYFDYASHAESQAPDHTCWSCATPLYETTPNCAFCGAVRSPSGWLRTA
jgi:hypothetical protein